MNRISPRTGRKYSPGQPEGEKVEVEPYENPHPFPPPPLNVAPLKAPRLALAARSPVAVAFRHIPGGWRRYIEYVDLAARKGDPGMVKFRDCYEALGAKRKVTNQTVWPEQICDMAGISPGELVGAVCRQIWESKAAESSMISAIAHPDVLSRTIALAKKEENFRDRELYFRMTGSLPDRKGNSINIYNQATGQQATLPELSQASTRLRTIDEEVIDMSREESPFLVNDVPSEGR